MKDKINITEIARIAGVHPSTVSRALNGSSLIREETRVWIQEIARKHGYIPDAVAKSLSQGKTFTLGIIVPEISNTFYSHIVDAIEQTVATLGYSLLLCSSRFDRDTEWKAVQTLLSKRVDALVICAPLNMQALEPLAQRTPIILCDVMADPSGFDHVSVDEEAGMAAALDHLIEKGHQRIGCLADRVTVRRAQLFRGLLEKRGLPVNEDYFYEGETMGASCGYDGIHALADRGSPPTALFAARDNIAVGAMRAAIEQNLRIPEQLALVGYDDLTISSFLYKTLTTIRQPAEDIGNRVAEQLLHRLGHRDSPAPTDRLVPTLICRETT